ncbi:MAG: hypothetical protein ACRD2D_00415, partial [Terriglobales bacterium]
MTVRVEYAGHGSKLLILLSEGGSSVLRHRGLEPLLEAERKDAELSATDGSALVPRNYTFQYSATAYGLRASSPLGGDPLRPTSRLRLLRWFGQAVLG